jgi:hypothetical protein
MRSIETTGVSDPRISNLAIIGLADISLQKTAQTARSGRGRPVCEAGWKPAPVCATIMAEVAGASAFAGAGMKYAGI